MLTSKETRSMTALRILVPSGIVVVALALVLWSWQPLRWGPQYFPRPSWSEHTTSGTTGASSSSKLPGVNGVSKAGCPISEHWQGWDKIKHAFLFGDSYTSTTFDSDGEQPSDERPFGNPEYSLQTACYGRNWVNHLAYEYNETLLHVFNYAWGGATITKGVLEPLYPDIVPMDEQVQLKFFPHQAMPGAREPWASEDTLFGIWVGINDHFMHYDKMDFQAADVVKIEIFAIFSGLMEMLYSTGARNFLLFDVPAVELSPLTAYRNDEANAKPHIDRWNELMKELMTNFYKEHNDINIFFIPIYDITHAIIKDPSTYEWTSSLTHTTDWCEEYGGAFRDTERGGEGQFHESCGAPIEQYFWLNSVHPTCYIHDFFGQLARDQLLEGPNWCPR